MAYKQKYNNGDKVLIKPYERNRVIKGERIEDFTVGTILRFYNGAYYVRFHEKLEHWFYTVELHDMNKFDVGL